MAFYLSPLVDVNEIDLTTTIPAAATSIAALVIRRSWKGSEMKTKLVTNLEELITEFGRPTDESYKDMLAAIGYLTHGNKLYCTRAMPTTSTFSGIYGSLGSSASSIASFTAYTTGQAFTLSDFESENPDEFQDETFQFSSLPTSGHNISIIANTRGAWGNYTKVAIIDYNTYNIAISAFGSSFAYYQSIGGLLNEDVWESLERVDYPIESEQEFIIIVKAAAQQNVNKTDITYDEKEVWYVSTNVDAKDDQGSSLYAPTVINNESSYIRIALDSDAQNSNFYCMTTSFVALGGGKDDFTTWDSDPLLEDTAVTNAYNLYANAEEIDVNILIDADKRLTVKSLLITIAEDRKDCIAILDCLKTHVVNQSGSEVENLRNYRLKTLNESSSYAAFYGNWLDVWDNWNSMYRWIPASGHVAGILAKTDDVADPWFAPAGLNRGILGSVRKLAWAPTQGERDILYKNGVNPIASFAGQGKVIWGQKTLLDKESAFNRINVRRLFMVIEKAISTSAKYFLFEPNDEFTRLSMINMIDPYLRDVRGRRGIYDFMIVCDERNNTAERIDRQELWMDIYIKPVRAAEFIVLNFIATKTGASFTELVSEYSGEL